jgi:hypothetical protein
MFKRVLCTFCVMSLAWACPFRASEPQRNRTKFVEALNRVQKGMSEAAVLALLGRPDQTTVKEPPAGEALMGTRHHETWRYGVMREPAIATLGEVEIDQEHEVSSIEGQGKPLPEELFTEQQIRNLIDLLSRVRYDGTMWHNPKPLIRAVNALQPLGKEKALAAIDEYLRGISYDSRQDGVFLVLRTLFEWSDRRHGRGPDIRRRPRRSPISANSERCVPSL